jgi:hypothetical protein
MYRKLQEITRFVSFDILTVLYFFHITCTAPHCLSFCTLLCCYMTVCVCIGWSFVCVFSSLLHSFLSYFMLILRDSCMCLFLSASIFLREVWLKSCNMADSCGGEFNVSRILPNNERFATLFRLKDFYL